MKIMGKPVQVLFLLVLISTVSVVALADEPSLWDKAKNSANKGWEATKEGAGDAAEWSSDEAGKAVKATKKQSKKAWKKTKKAAKKGAGKAADWVKEKTE